MKRLFLFCITFLGVATAAVAQSPKISVAIIPFAQSMPEYRPRASQVQDLVLEVIGKKSNIILIDRSKDTLLFKELDRQITEYSVEGSNLVKQGRVMGAQNMITGTISNVNVEEEKESNGTGLLGTIKKFGGKYKANVSFSLQLIDVETGKFISQKSFNNSIDNDPLGISTLGTGDTKESAIAAAIANSKRKVLAWINESYPPEIKILKIEERNKKGFPETVLVTGIDASLSKGTKLLLNEVEILDAGDGKKLKRSKPVAQLKISEFQGDITICKITDGEKDIEGKMTAGAKFEILIK